MESDSQKEQFKRQALQFILSIYLQRQNDEDVKFIRDNVKSTADFAKNISSSLKYGLSESTIQKNHKMYGRNSKRTVRTFSLIDIISRVIKLHNILIFFICIVQVIFGTVLKNRQIYMDAVYALILLACVLLIRIVTIFLNEKKKSQQSYEKNKNEKYRVFRDGNFIELQQTRIVVGDIIQLDYKEKVPASGILISNQQIAMNEEIYGKKTQRKMCLEKCISYINKLSVLQLKIDAQKQSLPSPIILRGSDQVYGSTYRILVVAVNEQNLLEKHKVSNDSTFVSDIIKEWFQKLQCKVGKIMLVISVIYLVLFMSLFSLKQYLERKHLSVEMFFTDLFSVLLMSILSFSVFDTNCLRLFVQTQVISYTQNLSNPKQVDKYLTVEQIYITEDNIVKYDEIIVCQIGIPDRQHVVKYEELNVLNHHVRCKVEEVLEGVGLKEKKSQKRQFGMLCMKEEQSSSEHENHFNQIVHLNTVDQKIFTSLLAPAKQAKNQADEINLKMKQVSRDNNLNPNQQENASNLSLNKVTPQQDEVFNQFKRPKFRKKQLTTSEKKGDVHNQQTLKGYLSQFCKFKTQNIVQGIVELAKHQSKTYYYQKYTINRLKNIPYVYQNGCEHQMNKQRFQKTKRLARNVRVIEGLTPFLIGYTDGAYSNSSMNVLVAVIGVRINYENEIIQRLKELGALGIKSTILIHKREEDEKNSLIKDSYLMTSKITSEFHEEEDYTKTVCAEYVSRGWISQEAQQMIDFGTLKESGGAIRCQACFLSRCDCKDRVQELCNIQNFISQSQNTKIIYSIDTECDINYLKVGSQQIRNSVLMINKYKSQTVKILEGIKRGYYLSNILEKGQNVWYGFMFVSAVCFYPLSLVSFGGVFCSGDISLWILFIQFLAVIGNMDISIQAKENTESESRRKKILYSKKSTMEVFLLCMISTVVATVFYIQPTLFIQQSFTQIAQHLQNTTPIIFDRDCNFKFTIFLSSDFNNLQCIVPASDQSHQSTSSTHSSIPQYIYSQNVNFMFSYLCLNMLIFLMINFRNFTRPKVLAVYGCLVGVYFYVIYVSPDIIHGRFDGLTPGQLAIVFAMSVLTNLVIHCIAYWCNYSCAVCDTEEFQSILAFQDDVENHYSTKLKKYSAFQTQIYTLN